MRHWKDFAGVRRAPRTLLAVLMGLLLTGNAFADRQQALSAQASGDYAGAARLWLPLANDGDPIAQYNLALLYQRGAGVTADANLSRYWFSMAARHGMVEAYTIVNAQAVSVTRSKPVASAQASAAPTLKPTPKPAVSTSSTNTSLNPNPNPSTDSPEDWVAAQNPNYYTLQLASSTNKALIDKYYSENDLAGKAGYYRSKREGEDWYSLIYGAYPTVQDAKDAIESLPADLKKWSPWVRNIKSIHRIMVR